MKRVTAVILNVLAGLGLLSLIGGWTLFLASSYDYTSPRDRFGARTGDFLWVYAIVWAIPFVLYLAAKIYRFQRGRTNTGPNQSPKPTLAGGQSG